MHGRCHRGSHDARLRATRRPCGACAARPSHLGTRRTCPAFEFAARISPRSTSRLQRDDPVMKTRARRTPASLPEMMAELSLASWETIARRTLLMAQGRCSPSEYTRMVQEKTFATQASFAAMGSLTGAALSAAAITTMLAPWHRGATANVRRLRSEENTYELQSLMRNSY